MSPSAAVAMDESIDLILCGGRVSSPAFRIGVAVPSDTGPDAPDADIERMKAIRDAARAKNEQPPD